MPNPDLFPLDAIAEAARAFSAASRTGGTHWLGVLTVLVCVLVGLAVAWRNRREN